MAFLLVFFILKLYTFMGVQCEVSVCVDSVEWFDQANLSLCSPIISYGGAKHFINFYSFILQLEHCVIFYG